MTLRVRAVDLFEQPLSLRLPFRFGAATVTRAPQAFVRVELDADGRRSIGATAELMVPKWFDKSPRLTHEQNFEQLRSALHIARSAWLDAGDAASAYTLSLAATQAAMRRATGLGLPRLAAQFGPAQLDKAVADALLRATGLSWCNGLRCGVLGDPWSATLPITQAESVMLRHTVGLADRLTAADPGADPGDGLPTTLQDAIAAYGLRAFKLKLSGQADADVERLVRIAGVLRGIDYRATLDGNESFADAAALAGAWRRFRAEPALADLLARTLLLEQPLPRAITLSTPIAELGITVPVIIDEADDHDEAFDQALALGYRGVSSKACKGIFRSLRNAHVVANDSRELLLSGEDLTCQPGLALQQDTLLATSLGVTQIERNGHHYVGGFAAGGEAFAEAHTGLYRRTPQGVRLAVRDGQLDLRSLHAPGFGTAVHPTWDLLQPLTNL